MSKFSHQELYKSPQSLAAGFRVGSPSSRKVPTTNPAEVDSPNNLWRNAYKKRCFDEFKKSRQKLVNRFRNCQLDESNPVKVKDIIEQELEKICLLEAKTSPDLLSIEEAAELYEQIEREILLSIMQDEEDELNQRLLKEYEAEQSHLEKSFEDERASILCPICQRANLREDADRIVCQNSAAGQCTFAVLKKTAAGGVCIIELERRLESAMSDHACMEVPRFRLDDSPVSLKMLCDKCQFAKVIF